MTINDVLYKIRNSDGKAFRLVSVRSTGTTAGVVKSADYIFADFIDTNLDLIKVKEVGEGEQIKTLKISHLLVYNKNIIIHK